MAPRRRRNMKDLLVPDPTPERQLEHPSGWCITGHHDGCRYQFDHGKCGCWCHTGKPKPVQADEDAPKRKRSTRAPKPTAEATAAPKRRGRPPKAPVAPIDEDDPRPWKRNNGKA